MNIKKIFKNSVLSSVACMGIVGMSFASTHEVCSEYGLSLKQKEQVKLFVHQAKTIAEKQGVQKACQEFMSSKFIREGLYIFVIDHRQYSLANGGRSDFVGKSLATIRDARDSAKKIIHKAQQGGGWVNYQWMSPKTHTMRCKSSWVTPLLKDSKSNQMYTIGAGIEHE